MPEYTISYSEDEWNELHGKKKRGCGCLLVILFIIILFICLGSSSDKTDDKTDENSTDSQTEQAEGAIEEVTIKEE